MIRWRGDASHHDKIAYVEFLKSNLNKELANHTRNKFDITMFKRGNYYYAYKPDFSSHNGTSNEIESLQSSMVWVL